MQIHRIVCLHQFFRPEPSNIRPPGWGYCARKLDDDTIEYCRKNRWNKNCGGYHPITITMGDIKNEIKKPKRTR